MLTRNDLNQLLPLLPELHVPPAYRLVGISLTLDEFMDLFDKEFMLLCIDYAVEELHITLSSQTKNLIQKIMSFIEIIVYCIGYIQVLLFYYWQSQSHCKSFYTKCQ